MSEVHQVRASIDRDGPWVVRFRIKWLGLWWPVPGWFFEWHVDRFCVEEE